MSALTDFGLISDPFSVTVNEMSVTRWAGREREKQTLLDVIESVLRSDIGSSEFVVVHGEYGAGKSHALRYLATQINEERRDHYKSKAVYLQTLRVSERVRFLDVYKAIIGVLGKSFIAELSAKIADQVNNAKVDYLDKVPPESRSSLLADPQRHLNETLKVGASPEAIPFLKLMFRANGGALDDVWRYLKGDNGSFEDIGLAAAVSNDYAAVTTLAGIFRVMCAQIGTRGPAYEAAYLFVDEQENMVDLKATESVQLLQSFRELINQLPNNFCMIWGFSADAALIEAVLPNPILQRLTRKYVELPSMQPDEAKRFLREHLREYRPPNYSPPTDYYPFSEAAIDLVLERIVDMTPRNIFKSLRAVLERAIRRYGLEPPNEISPELAQEILDLQG